IKAIRSGLVRVLGVPHHTKMLTLSGNAIEDFPDCFGPVSELETLDLCYNQISEFSFSHLKSLPSSLKVLYLSWNNLQGEFPNQLTTHLPLLEKFSIEGNEDLTYPPEEIINLS